MKLGEDEMAQAMLASRLDRRVHRHALDLCGGSRRMPGRGRFRGGMAAACLVGHRWRHARASRRRCLHGHSEHDRPHLRSRSRTASRRRVSAKTSWPRATRYPARTWRSPALIRSSRSMKSSRTAEASHQTACRATPLHRGSAACPSLRRHWPLKRSYTANAPRVVRVRADVRKISLRTTRRWRRWRKGPCGSGSRHI